MILIYSKSHDGFVNKVFCYFLKYNILKIGLIDGFKMTMVSVNKTATIAVHTSYKENADLTKIKAIWFNGGKIQNPELENISDELKHLLDDNYSTVLEGFLKFANVFKIGRSINPFECSKMDVLLLAQEVGFLIPDTLFTENKSDLNNFYQKYSKKGHSRPKVFQNR
jgi:hypothetical protein